MFERLKKRVVVAATLLLTFCGLQAADVVAQAGVEGYTTLQAASDFFELPVQLSGEELTKVKISRGWIESQEALKGLANDEDVRKGLLAAAKNGNPLWVNYVLGIANDAKLQVSFKKATESTADKPKTQVLFDLTFNAPSDTGVTVNYTLVTSTDGGVTWSLGEASKSPAFTVDMPDADKTLYFIKVSIEQAN